MQNDKQQLNEIFRIATIVQKCSGDKTIGAKHIDATLNILQYDKYMKSQCVENVSHHSDEYNYDLFLNKLKCIDPSVNKTACFYLAPLFYYI